MCTNSVFAQIQYLRKFSICTKNIGGRICIMWQMIWMICTLTSFGKSDHRVNSRSGSVLGRLWLHRIFLNNLHIDSYTKYEILFVTSLDHRIFFESSFSVFWGTSVVIIFGRKWSYKKTFESTTHLLCKIMIMVKEVSPVPYCSTHFSWTIEYYHLSSIIIDILFHMGNIILSLLIIYNYLYFILPGQ